MLENLHEESAKEYFETAKVYLEKKDLVGFIENIGCAKLLAQTDMILYAKIVYYKAIGLYLLREYEKSLEAIDEALEWNDGIEKIRLLKFKGLVFGYRGQFEEAIRLFRDLVNQSEEEKLQAEILINLAWAYLSFYRVNEDQGLLTEALHYLDRVYQVFHTLDNIKRKRILTNYSDYYFLNKDYIKAIEMQEEAIAFCNEDDLPKVYNNLAELHLMYEELSLVDEYLHKAEVIANKFGNYFEIGQASFIKGLAQAQDEELLKAKDSFYLALAYFSKAQAYPLAFNCFTKILEISQQFNMICIQSLRENSKGQVKDSMFFETISKDF